MQDLKQRTFHFAVNTGKLIQALPYNTVNKAYSAQLIRCSSSVGANYRAACRAKSPADFIYKLKIVEEETDETMFWLEILEESNLIKYERIKLVKLELNEILAIVVSSIKTVKAKIGR